MNRKQIAAALALVSGLGFSAQATALTVKTGSLEAANYVVKKTYIATDDKTVTLTQAGYTTVLSYTIPNAALKDGDIFTITGNGGFTNQSWLMDDSGNAVAYVDCNGKQASPIARKSLRREYGNHHGSMFFFGSCQVSKIGKEDLTIRLIAKSENTIEDLVQVDVIQVLTNLFISHLTERSNIPSGADFWSLTRVLSGTPQLTDDITIPCDVYQYFDISTLRLDMRAGDIAYLGSHTSAWKPTNRNPMFGVKLLANKVTLDVATENLTPEISNFSQRLTALYQAPSAGLYNLRSIAYCKASDLSRTFDIKASRSDFDGYLLARKSENGYRLSNVSQTFLSANTDVFPNAKTVNLDNYARTTFTGAGVLKANASISISYKGAKAQSCSMQMKTYRNGILMNRSVYSSRTFTAAYRWHQMTGEVILKVDSKGGVYKVVPSLVCTSSDTETSLELYRSGTLLQMETYQ